MCTSVELCSTPDTLCRAYSAKWSTALYRLVERGNHLTVTDVRRIGMVRDGRRDERSMNLEAIPVIDAHGHPFDPTQGEVSSQWMRDAFSEGLSRPSSPANESSFLSRMLVKSLSRLIDCEPTWSGVLEARNALARADHVAYNHRLFTDAGIVAALIDPGFPSNLIDPADFATVVPCPVFEGYRIERFTGWGEDSVFAEGRHATFADFIDDFRATLDAEAARPGMTFFKTVIAYLTGLSIPSVSDADAMAAWKTHPASGEPADKVLRDFLFRETALKAKEHGVPFQVHTGHTSESNPWPNVNPILLTPLLNDPEMLEVSFVLVHGGYPFCTEAGYLTSVYPNVSLDLSLMIPWSSIGIARRIEETLELAPTDKVMYGSDGIMVPELFWISALNTRKALGRVLDRLVDDDVLDTPEALEVARDIFYRNAERIYGLSIVTATP